MNFTPVDPNATEEVKKVLSFFADIEGKGIITGQLTLTCVNSTCMNMPLRWTNCRNCMRWNEGQAYIEFSRKKTDRMGGRPDSCCPVFFVGAGRRMPPVWRYRPIMENQWIFISAMVYCESERRSNMKLKIVINKEFREPEAVITTAEMTEEVTKAADYLTSVGERNNIITGIRDEKVEILDQDTIVRIFSQDGKVFCETDHSRYQMRLRLYELEERLDSGRFVRISNSEIVNLKKVENLDLSFAGTICIKLNNKAVSYVSRRYVSKMKKILGL